MKYRIFAVALSAAASLHASTAFAQAADHSTMDHSKMDRAPKPAPKASSPDPHAGHADPVDSTETATKPSNATAGSGSSLIPGADGMMPGPHLTSGGWNLMLHGHLWGIYSDQGGPRGDKMGFVTSMAMVEGSRSLSDTTRLQLRAMISLDPLIGDRGYPNLFATGETAGGVPLVDRQHPHDFFMELSARIDTDLGGGITGFLYGGPVAEPALGPSAFMHRASSRLNPEAPISHHWFDSTHITFGVVTAGIVSGHFQIEGSAFRGREPDEARWDIETPKLDSWSVRGTWAPSPNWTASLSYGRLESPEALHPGEDEARTIATLAYSDGRLAVTGAYARKKRMPGPALDAWLVEANWALSQRQSVFGRFENVENDELFDHHDPLHGIAFRVSKFAVGYAYSLPLKGPLNLDIGGSASLYAKPAALDAAYGRNPASFTLFAKLSLGD